MTRYTREDVQTHGIGNGYRSLPAVNVKVYTRLTDDICQQAARDVLGVDAPGFTAEWCEDRDEDGTWFQAVCESESEYYADWCKELFAELGYNVKVWHEGRQGGWMVVEGLPDLEDWDAILLAKWRKWERVAKEGASYIPYQMASLLLMNVWEPLEDGKREDREAARAEGVMA